MRLLASARLLVCTGFSPGCAFRARDGKSGRSPFVVAREGEKCETSLPHLPNALYFCEYLEFNVTVCMSAR
jgi:hypothetical protein